MIAIIGNKVRMQIELQLEPYKIGDTVRPFLQNYTYEIEYIDEHVIALQPYCYHAKEVFKQQTKRK